MTAQLLVGLEEIRSRWGWYLLLGIILLAIGIVAIGPVFVTSIGSITLLGGLVLLSGLVQALLAFRVRNWSGFFLHLLGGVLEVIVGLLIVASPVTAALAGTVVVGVYPVGRGVVP